MPEPMTLDRFRALADAYGGSMARWPDDARAAASVMVDDPACRAILREAAALDATLDRWAPPSVDPAFAESLVRSAPLRGASVWRRTRLVWPAIGLATALAGAAAGSLAVTALTPPDVPAGVGTVFGDVAGYGG